MSTAGQRTFRFECAYDGASYHGWQIQPDVTTVQGRLRRAFGSVFNTAPTLYGASRTDQGVHAFRHTVHFVVDPDEVGPPVDRWSTMVNQRLPRTVRMFRLRETDPGFHARHSAVSRAYAYRFRHRRTLRFSDRRYCWEIDPRFWKMPAAREAVNHLDGTIPTRVFSGGGDSAGYDADRWSVQLRLREVTPGDVWLTVRSRSFRYRMVRCVATAVKRVLCNIWDLDDLRRRLSPEKGMIDAAPARGCFLVRAFYQARPDSFYRRAVWKTILDEFYGSTI